MASAHIIETPSDFRDTLGGMSYQYDLPLKPPASIEPDIRHAIDAIFSDLQYISKDEPELVRCYLDGIEEPLQSLSSFGLMLFALVSSGTCHLGDGKQIPNWTSIHYFIVPSQAYFALGRDLSQTVHRFDPTCDSAISALVSVSQKSAPFTVYGSKEPVRTAHEGAVPWCVSCCLSEIGS